MQTAKLRFRVSLRVMKISMLLLDWPAFPTAYNSAVLGKSWQPDHSLYRSRRLNISRYLVLVLILLLYICQHCNVQLTYRECFWIAALSRKRTVLLSSFLRSHKSQRSHQQQWGHASWCQSFKKAWLISLLWRLKSVHSGDLRGFTWMWLWRVPGSQVEGRCAICILSLILVELLDIRTGTCHLCSEPAAMN